MAAICQPVWSYMPAVLCAMFTLRSDLLQWPVAATFCSDQSQDIAGSLVTECVHAALFGCPRVATIRYNALRNI